MPWCQYYEIQLNFKESLNLQITIKITKTNSIRQFYNVVTKFTFYYYIVKISIMSAQKQQSENEPLNGSQEIQKFTKQLKESQKSQVLDSVNRSPYVQINQQSFKQKNQDFLPFKQIQNVLQYKQQNIKNKQNAKNTIVQHKNTQKQSIDINFLNQIKNQNNCMIKEQQKQNLRPYLSCCSKFNYKIQPKQANKQFIGSIKKNKNTKQKQIQKQQNIQLKALKQQNQTSVHRRYAYTFTNQQRYRYPIQLNRIKTSFPERPSYVSHHQFLNRNVQHSSKIFQNPGRFFHYDRYQYRNLHKQQKNIYRSPINSIKKSNFQPKNQLNLYRNNMYHKNQYDQNNSKKHINKLNFQNQNEGSLSYRETNVQLPSARRILIQQSTSTKNLLKSIDTYQQQSDRFHYKRQNFQDQVDPKIQSLMYRLNYRLTSYIQKHNLQKFVVDSKQKVKPF